MTWLPELCKQHSVHSQESEFRKNTHITTSSLNSSQSHLDLDVVELHEVAVVSVSVERVLARGLCTAAHVLETKQVIYSIKWNKCNSTLVCQKYLWYVNALVAESGSLTVNGYNDYIGDL